MKNQRLLGIIMLLISLVTGIAIIAYYWMNNTLESIVHVPLFLMVIAFVYILAQILKRSLLKKQYWWDWLYYIGLIAIVTPTFIGKESNESMLHILTDVGTIFLILPLLLDGKQLFNNKK